LTKGKIMTAEELASYIELLVMEGRASGLSDETMATQLQDAADALREGVSSGATHEISSPLRC
jgi:hypothetical protein